MVADRYIPDFLVWTALTTNDLDYLRSFSAKFLLATASKAGIKAYVTARHGELVKRKEDSNPSFLRRQLKLYERLAMALSVSKLDTTEKSVNESIDELCNMVGVLGNGEEGP